ncbi:MAG: cell filamentation protein Fic [Coxiella sp. (in: Bacteria)]|nr:MAG: cell filamentation protein Fic [Coxiella sp. (in: g-proteobacteria)]
MKAPPITITAKILKTSLSIAEILGSISTLHLEKPDIGLRKQNKIKAIQGSLAVEGNTLSLAQVTDLIDDKWVLGPKQDIKEVKNAIAVYQDLTDYSFSSINAFKRAHKILTQGLIDAPGSFRAGNVGIFAGKHISHVAPPAKQVARLMDNLFSFIKCKDELTLLIKACVFHYELEFIHPFSDGNGRMGRLWQQIILMKYHPVFEFLSVELLIKENQNTYYDILGTCDASGESTLFVEFMLALILDELEHYKKVVTYAPKTKQDRLELAAAHFKKQWFSRQKYMIFHKTVSSATASRDLRYAVDSGMLEMQGAQRLSRYHFR